MIQSNQSLTFGSRAAIESANMKLATHKTRSQTASADHPQAPSVANRDIMAHVGSCVASPSWAYYAVGFALTATLIGVFTR